MVINYRWSVHWAVGHWLTKAGSTALYSCTTVNVDKRHCKCPYMQLTLNFLWRLINCRSLQHFFTFCISTLQTYVIKAKVLLCKKHEVKWLCNSLPVFRFCIHTITSNNLATAGEGKEPYHNEKQNTWMKTTFHFMDLVLPNAGINVNFIDSSLVKIAI